MSSPATTILAIGAHLDDTFIGAGGLLLQAARAGCRVVTVSIVSDFSTRLATCGQEEGTCADIMALGQRHGFDTRLLGYPYHRIDASDMRLKERLAEIALEVRPDVVIIHHHEDHWPDHSACAKLSFDAAMFTHGLTKDLTQRYCRHVFAYTTTPRQTFHFPPDVFYDVGDVMSDYMELILSIDAIAHRKTPEALVRARFALEGKTPASLRLSEHGLLRLADCLRWGDLAGCRFGLALRTVWGDRRGPALWKANTP